MFLTFKTVANPPTLGGIRGFVPTSRDCTSFPHLVFLCTEKHRNKAVRGEPCPELAEGLSNHERALRQAQGEQNHNNVFLRN